MWLVNIGICMKRTGKIFTANVISKFQNLIYTLELSCKTSINVVYTGDANEITLKDLEPATSYQLRVYAALPSSSSSSACRGEFTPAVSFETRACEPSQPELPKLLAKKKNELSIRWLAPSDNGSKITSYTLEYQPVSHPITGTFNLYFQFSFVFVDIKKNIF